MERKYKIALIITGSVLLATAIGITIYQLTKKEDSNETESGQTLPAEPSNSSSAATSTRTTLGGASSSWEVDGIEPIYNTENELSNPLPELKGQNLYAKPTSEGGWGYANVRTSAEVNNDTGFWTDGVTNLITTIQSGTPIGKVVSEATGVYNGYAYRWLKVTLATPTGGWFFPYTQGFVRADTVTFKPYTP